MKGLGEMINKTETYNGMHISIWLDGDLTSATVYDLEKGLHATGHARRHPSDEYDEALGTSLAFWRALGRLASKQVRHRIRSLA